MSLADTPTGRDNCQSLFKQCLLPRVQFFKSSPHPFGLYAVPEDVRIVPAIVKGNILARFLTDLVRHIEGLVIVSFVL